MMFEKTSGLALIPLKKQGGALPNLTKNREVRSLMPLKTGSPSLIPKKKGCPP